MNQKTTSQKNVTQITNPDDLLQNAHGAEVKPVIHIGFPDYTLFNDCPEFYATYKLLNVKNHHVYSDNLTLSVVDLSHIELATDEDKEYHIVYWAKLFKATTWAKIKTRRLLPKKMLNSLITRSLLKNCSVK